MPSVHSWNRLGNVRISNAETIQKHGGTVFGYAVVASWHPAVKPEIQAGLFEKARADKIGGM
jgi:hypothetical protein